MSVGAVNKQTGDRIQTAGLPAVDSVLSGTSTNPVQNKVVKEALDGKQDTLTFDDTPTDGSNNPVKSNGIYDALATKADTDMVAEDFNAGTSYTAGNYCIYEGKFYKFKASHSGAWSAADVDEIKIAGELSSLKSGLTNVNNSISRIDNVPLYVTATNDIELASEASGTISFTKSSFTIPSGYTANWGACIYSVVGAWGIPCDYDACFNSGELYFTDSNALVVNIKSHVSAGNVNFRAAVSIMITPTT